MTRNTFSAPRWFKSVFFYLKWPKNQIRVVDFSTTVSFSSQSLGLEIKPGFLLSVCFLLLSERISLMVILHHFN